MSDSGNTTPPQTTAQGIISAGPRNPRAEFDAARERVLANPAAHGVDPNNTDEVGAAAAELLRQDARRERINNARHI